MKPSLLALAAAVALASSSGCCRIERLFCYGFCDGGPWGPSYGHEGPCGGSSYCDGPCSDCAAVGRRTYGGPGALAEEDLYEPAAAQSTAPRHPAEALPLDHEDRDSGDLYELLVSPKSDVTDSQHTDRDIPHHLAPDSLEAGF